MSRRDDRIAQLGKVMVDAGVEVYLAASPVTMNYFHGYAEASGERFLVMAIRNTGEIRLIAPSLAENQARRSGLNDVRLWSDGQDPMAHFAELVKDWNLGGAKAAVDDDMYASKLLDMQNTAGSLSYIHGHPIRAQLMSRKDAGELELMHKAGQIADQAYLAAMGQVKEGMTEHDLEKIFFAEMSARGGQPTFSIMGFGANGAEPHHHNDGTQLKKGDVMIMDFGCLYGGYNSDVTRTAAFGQPDAEAFKVYEVVYSGHMNAVEHIKPCVSFESVDGMARQTIADAGYGQFFTHRLGHGVGMNIHEKPDVVAGEKLPMAAGHCFSIEPGIYLEGRFGVRIENLYTCQEGGAVSFNSAPPATLTVI